MSIFMVIEHGEMMWQCDECEETFFDYEDVAYGHDCEF